jgi:hypothetical protein
MKKCIIFMTLIVMPGIITAASVGKQSLPPVRTSQKKYSYGITPTITIQQLCTQEAVLKTPAASSIELLEGYPLTLLPKEMTENPLVDGATYVAIYTGREGKGPKNKKALEQDPQVKTIPGDYVIIGLDNPDKPKIFTNIRAKESALTGTPGYLSDHKNYFGMAKLQESTPGKMGSGKRIDFYTE